VAHSSKLACTLHALQPLGFTEVSTFGKSCIYSTKMYCSVSSIWNKLTVYNADILSVLCIVHWPIPQPNHLHLSVCIYFAGTYISHNRTKKYGIIHTSNGMLEKSILNGKINLLLLQITTIKQVWFSIQESPHCKDPEWEHYNMVNIYHKAFRTLHNNIYKQMCWRIYTFFMCNRPDIYNTT
jgi:hypothetical protein